jgi:hypothetical protein
MRLFVSAFLVIALSASLGVAQEYVPPQSAQANGGVIGGVAGMEGVLNTVPQFARSQTGCPVVLTSAQLNWPASYLPVTSAERVTEPNLALGFHNASGKGIRSVTITARFLGKQNVYQLDANAFDLRLTFSGVDAADKAAEQLRDIRVPEKMYAYGVTRVSLEQVLFADGTFWTAFGHGNCNLDVRGSAERVAK